MSESIWCHVVCRCRSRSSEVWKVVWRSCPGGCQLICCLSAKEKGRKMFSCYRDCWGRSGGCRRCPCRLKWSTIVFQRETIVRSPIIWHLVRLHVIPGELVKEMLRVKLTNNPLLVDLLDIQRASRTIRVPDLEVNGVHGAFPRISGWRHLPGCSSAGCPGAVVGVVVVVVVWCGSGWWIGVQWRVKNVSRDCRCNNGRKGLMTDVICHVRVARSHRSRRAALGCWPRKSRHGCVTFVSHSPSLTQKWLNSKRLEIWRRTITSNVEDNRTWGPR